EESGSSEASEETGIAVPITIQTESSRTGGESATPLQAAGAVAGGSGDAMNLAGTFVNQADAPSCMDCGSIMIRNGACYKCPNCGSTSGCS
ncbi:MAG: hypothetical protein VCB25_11145, partial [Myxococcota bacterium]